MIDIFQSVAEVFAGLGLFFAGHWFLTESLKKLSGDKLRTTLVGCIGTPVRGFIWGLGSGALTQTATVSVFVLAGLLASGLTTIKMAVPVLLGANIGTSALIFLTTLHFESVILVVTGAVGMLLANEKCCKQRTVVSVVFGICLLFIGIDMLQQGAVAAVEQTWAEQLLVQHRDSYFLGFLVGTALRFIAQSGTAVTILVVTLCGTGVMSTEQTIMTIYGVNFGAAISTWVLSVGLQGSPKKIANYQVWFDVLGSIVLVPLFYLEVHTGVPLVRALVSTVFDEISHQMAGVYLLFNVISSITLVVALSLGTIVVPLVNSTLSRLWGFSVWPIGASLAGVLVFLMATFDSFHQAEELGVLTESTSIPVQALPFIGSATAKYSAPQSAFGSSYLSDSFTHESNVRTLLDLAYSDLFALRLTTPTESNALDRFKSVLILDPENRQARQGLQLIVSQYVKLAKKAESDGGQRRAEIYMDRAFEVLFGDIPYSREGLQRMAPVALAHQW